MKKLETGWQIRNGSGWNRHETARSLQTNSAIHAMVIPSGYAVLVAPISDKPLGLRCALVRELPRKTDEDGLDDGPDGEIYDWARDNFGVEVERVYSCTVDSQSEDSSAYFIRKTSEAIAKIESEAAR